MEDEKKIVFNSSVEDINITNRLAHFQNSLFSKNYLDSNKKYAITPRQIYIDLNFKNPVCPVNNAFPSLICCPSKHFLKKLNDNYRPDSPTSTTNDESNVSRSSNANQIKLKFFYNIHKYFLNHAKKYSISELYEEWRSKEKIGVKTRRKYNKESNALYKPEELVLTNTFLKKTSDSILFGQHPIDDDYTIKKEEENFLFFHFKFAEKLGIVNQFSNGQEMLINGEKYYWFIPLSDLERPLVIKVNLENRGLLFKTPSILQIKCKNIKSYPFNSSFTKTIGVVNVKENDNVLINAFNHTFKGNTFFELENKLNETFEILITDENNSRLKLYEGVPTIVLISAIEDNMENEVNVACTSEITEFHPNNSPTDFTSVLNTPMQMSHEWKVALSSITFRNDFKFDSNYNFQFSYYQYNKSGKEILKRTGIRIDENVKTVKEIYESFKSILKSHNPEGNSEHKTRRIGSVKLTDEIMTMNFHRGTLLTLTPHLAMVLGVTNNPYEANVNNYRQESVSCEVGLEKNSNNEITGGSFIASKPINFNFNLKQKFMFVEMDAIKDVPVGNGHAKILKIVPLSVESSGLYVTKDFEILDFHPLSYHNIQNINFKLLSQSGSSMKTHNSEDYNNTWLQLVFRKFPKNDADEPPLKRAKFY